MRYCAECGAEIGPYWVNCPQCEAPIEAQSDTSEAETPSDGSEAEEGFQRRLGWIIAIVLVAAFGGTCAVLAGDPGNDDPGGGNPATDTPTEGAPTEGFVDEGSVPAKWRDDPADRASYANSRVLCRQFSVEEIAAEFGGSPDEPADVALTYAREVKRPEYVQPAFEGCLAGQEDRREGDP